MSENGQAVTGQLRVQSLKTAHNEVAEYLREGGSEADTIAEFRDWIREKRRSLYTDSDHTDTNNP